MQRNPESSPGEPPVRALVLAAGSSSRLGRPKALLEFGEKTALDLVVGALREAGVEQGVVVVGEHAEEIEARADPSPFSFVRNPAPERGRLGSIQVGLQVIGHDGDVLLWPVDRPLARSSTVRALLEAQVTASEGAGVLVPVARGRAGHPIVIRTLVLGAVARADADANLREVLREASPERVEVAVGDEGIHENLDTPDDYARARERWLR